MLLDGIASSPASAVSISRRRSGSCPDQGFSRRYKISYRGVKLPKVSAAFGLLGGAAQGRFAARSPVRDQAPVAPIRTLARSRATCRRVLGCRARVQGSRGRAVGLRIMTSGAALPSGCGPASGKGGYESGGGGTGSRLSAACSRCARMSRCRGSGRRSIGYREER